MAYNDLNHLYLKHLARPIDLDGYKHYSKQLQNGKSLEYIENIIKNCDETKEYISRVKAMIGIKKQVNESLKNFKPTDIKPHDVFDVIICRYKEDVSWVRMFEHFNCNVYIYDKYGDCNIIAKNVNIIKCSNIAFEDFVYLKHIIENYENISHQKRKIIFMQGYLDHCPNFFHRISNIHSFGNYESLYESFGMSNTWGYGDITEHRYFPIKRDMNDIGGGEYYMKEFKKIIDIDTDNLYSYFCKAFDLKEMDIPIYSPCGLFCTTHERISLHNIKIYTKIYGYITAFHYETNPIMMKVMSSVIERLWATICLSESILR